MPNQNDAYLVQWSEGDHQFHVEQASSALKESIADFLQKVGTDDYVTLAIAPTYEGANEICRALAEKRGLVWEESEMRWKDSK